jgi:signal transduction histidine kinase
MKGTLDEEVLRGIEEMAAIIDRNIQKSTFLIEDLLDLAEVGQRPLEPARVEIGQVVREIIEERSAAIKSRNARVEADRDLGSVYASKTHMYQVFSNLIENAIKHNTSKKPVISIEYRGKGPDGGHSYRVRDNGQAIDPATADRIFKPFVAGPMGSRGIGLATVEKIVGVYGGCIELCDEEGPCFDFVIFDAT